MKRGILKGTLKGTLKSAINRRKIENDILNVLKKSGTPLSTADIAKELGKTWHTIIRHCLMLEMDNKVTKITVGRLSIWMVKK